MANSKQRETEKPQCCNVHLRQGKEARKLVGWKQVRCDRPVGHEGNHVAHTKNAAFEWWNEQANPQQRESVS